MDPDQPPLTGSTLFVEEASYTFQQTTKQTTFVVIGRCFKCEFVLIILLKFHCYNLNYY